MSTPAKKLSERVEAFKNEVIAFVDQLSDQAWNVTCEGEQWSVGVTARHLGAGHFAISGMLGMIVRGKELPQLTMDQINAMSEKDAREHADCTKAQALEHLNKNGSELVVFVAGLSDADLDRKGSMPAFGGEVTASQFVDYIIFQSARQHFDSMKSAVGG